MRSTLSRRRPSSTSDSIGTEKTELRNQPLDGFSLASLGFPAAVANSVIHPQFPSISVSGLQSFGYDSGRTQRFDNWQVFSTVNKVIGKHMLKAGADLRQINFGRYQWGDGAGSYSFSADWTRGPFNTSAAAPTGQGLASLLLGPANRWLHDSSTSGIEPE